MPAIELKPRYHPYRNVVELQQCQPAKSEDDEEDAEKYCGVCKGVLNIPKHGDKEDGNEEDENRDDEPVDSLLESMSSNESFPLPSAASAVGTVHPCGHLIHVSCYYNYNNQRNKVNSGICHSSTTTSHGGSLPSSMRQRQSPPIVEILTEDGGSSVEIMSSLDFHSSESHEKDDYPLVDGSNTQQEQNEAHIRHKHYYECPTCYVQALLFVEKTSATPTVTATTTKEKTTTKAKSPKAKKTKASKTTTTTPAASSTTKNTEMKASTNAVQKDSSILSDEAIASMRTTRTPTDTPSVSYDDADTDIMNYYSFTNSLGDEEDEDDEDGKEGEDRPLSDAGTAVSGATDDLFVDTTNIMADNLLLLGIASTKSAKGSGKDISDNNTVVKVKGSTSSDEFHDPGNTTPTATGCNSNSNRSEQEKDGLKTNSSTASSSSFHPFFDSRGSKPISVTASFATTPGTSNVTGKGGGALSARTGIMITPGTFHRRKVNKRVRFFDDHHQTPRNIPSLASESSEDGNEEQRLEREASTMSSSKELGDVSTSNPTISDPGESSSGSTSTKKGVIVQVRDSGTTSTISAETDGDDDDDVGINPISDQDSTDLPLDSQSEDSRDDDIFNSLAGGLALPKADSKSLLWNVSTYDDEDAEEAHRGGAYFNKSPGGDFVLQLQEEMEEMRRRLVKAEKEREEATRIVNTTRTRELDTVAAQARQIIGLKKDIKELQNNRKVNQQEIMTTEEELAATQIQLETAIDTHQQDQEKLQTELALTKEQLEDTRYQLESCQDDLNAQAETAKAERDSLLQSHAKEQEAMMQTVDKLKQEVGKAYSILEEVQQELRFCQEEKLGQAQLALEEKDAILESHSEALLKIKEEHDEKLVALKKELENAMADLAIIKETTTSNNIKAKDEYEDRLAEATKELEKQNELLAEKDALIAVRQEWESKSREDYEERLAELTNALERQHEILTEKDTIIAAQQERERKPREEYEDELVKLTAKLGEVTTKLEDVTLRFDLEVQSKEDIEYRLQQSQEEVNIVKAELDEAKSVNLEDSEEMNFIKEELDATKEGMEKLLAIMQDSEKELVVLREELTAAKQALSASSSFMELQRVSTSTSMSTFGPGDASSVHSVQEELKMVKKELTEKNAFIQSQLNLAKGKLIEYVKTKESELEDTRKELASTKQALKNKNGVIFQQLHETERELEDLSSMKETLLHTMNDLAEKNRTITKQLQEAKKGLALLADTKRELTGTKKALSTTNVRLWSTFALVAVYVGHSLVEWGKSGNGQLTETEMAFDPSLTSTEIMAFDDAHMVDEFEAEFN